MRGTRVRTWLFGDPQRTCFWIEEGQTSSDPLLPVIRISMRIDGADDYVSFNNEEFQVFIEVLHEITLRRREGKHQ